MNMVLENVCETWVEIPKKNKGKNVIIILYFQARPVVRERFINKMFVRGDSVIIVIRNPK